MEILRKLSRKLVERQLGKYVIFNHMSQNCIYKFNPSRNIIIFAKHKNQTVTQENNKTLRSLQNLRCFSSDDNDSPDKQHSLYKSTRKTSNYEYSSTDKYSTDEETYKEQLSGGQRVKYMLEEAQTQILKDDFSFDKSAEDEIAITKKRTYIDPKDMTIFLFPGQGTQVVGMGKTLLSYPNVKEMFEIASDILGFDLLSLCLDGPQETLNQTIHCQPSIVVTSLAAVEKLKDEDPKIVENCVATAGFSVGEFTALVFSGAITFEEAIYLIKVRAEAMQYASDCVDSGMLSVVARDTTNIKQACHEAKDYCTNEEGLVDPVCSIANYMFPGARVIAGHTRALDYLQENAKKFLFRSAKRIPVSGAFHTDLMKPAQKALAEALAEVDFDIPAISVHSNVDGKKYQHAKHIRKQLVQQVVKPVKWEQTMHEMYQRKSTDNFPLTVEVGPGNQLGTILKRINVKAAKSYKKVDV